MSTNSLIAKPEGETWKGRYCHWDGHPDTMGANIWEIVQRDGLEKAREGLLSTNWSTIVTNLPSLTEIEAAKPDMEADYGTAPYMAWRFERGNEYDIVEGYGCGFKDEKDEWSTPSDCFGFPEYVYVLRDGGLEVLHPTDDGKAWVTKGLFPWDGPIPPWEDLM